MKPAWPRKKIRDIAQHSLGKMLDKSKNKGEFQPYLRNLNVRWFNFDLSDVAKMPILPEEAPKYTAVKGDLLICEGGYPGRAAIWDKDEPIHFQKALHRVRFAQPEHTKWFQYYLYSLDLAGTLRQHFNGAGIQHFTGETLAQFEVPLPSTPEVGRILAILDKAIAAIATAKANTEKNLQNARRPYESHSESVLRRRVDAGRERSLSDVCEISSALVDPRDEPFADLPHIGGANIESKTGALSELKTAREERLISGKFSFNENAILYSKIRPNLMKVARPDFAGLCSADIYPISAKAGEIDRDYLFHLFLSKGFTDYVISGSARAGIPKVNRDHLFAFRLSPPPSGEQRQIARILDALLDQTEHLTSLYRQKLAAFDELKQSLLHQAFTGAL